MARNKRYKSNATKFAGGTFARLPHSVLRSHGYVRLSFSAKVLLIDLLNQYKGDNNGDLCATFSIMEKRGWKSKATLQKALNELKAGSWVQLSRQGGRNHASLYALTFIAVDECQGKLDINSTETPSDAWRLKEPVVPLPELQRAYKEQRAAALKAEESSAKGDGRCARH